MEFPEITTDYPFVGRKQILTQLEEAWGKHRIFGVYGTRSVGKSRTIQEVLNRKLAVEQQAKCIVIDVRHINSSQKLHRQLCAELGVVPREDQEGGISESFEVIFETISKNQTVQHLLVFDNTEDIIEGEDSFLTLCADLIRRCKNVRIFLTSTTKALFVQLKPTYFSTLLEPMTVGESVELLQIVAPSVQFGEYLHQIADLCCGLPLAILMAGSYLEEDVGAFEPKDLVELLVESRLKALSCEHFPREDRVGDLYREFLARLSWEFQKRLVILGYIPGTFSAEHVKNMLEHKSVATAKFNTIIPLHRRSMLQYIPVTKRFDIHGILRDCLDIHRAIKDLKPEIHRKYCRTFVEEMKKIQQQMDSSEYASALANFSLEHPNLQKLLKEVIFSEEDTYPFFIEVANSCSTLMERFMSADGEKFYMGCLKLTNRFGQQVDEALVRTAYGSLLTNAKGDFPTAESYYRKALSILMQGKPSIHLATIYHRLGWNLHVQWRREEGVKHLRKALEVCSQLHLDKSELFLTVLNSLGIVCTSLGDFGDGKKYNLECLKRSITILGPTHPHVGATHNALGIFYDQLGEHELALFHFEQGLEIKLKSKAHTMSMSASYNNVALQYCELKQFDTALEYLDRALENLKGPVYHRAAMGSTLDNFGKVYFKQGNYEKAVEYFKKSLEFREKIATNGPPHAETLKHLAQTYIKQGKFQEAIVHAQTVLSFRFQLYKRLQQVRYVYGALECLLEANQALNNVETLPGLYKETEKELLRLIEVFKCQENQKRVKEFGERLDILHEKM